LQLAIVDYNADSIPDMLLSVYTGITSTVRTLPVLFAGASVDFSSATVSLNANDKIGGIVTADFNADGVADLAVVSPGSGTDVPRECLLPTNTFQL
jgi:hypothetical protein